MKTLWWLPYFWILLRSAAAFGGWWCLRDAPWRVVLTLNGAVTMGLLAIEYIGEKEREARARRRSRRDG
jgi:hypothetical protein